MNNDKLLYNKKLLINRKLNNINYYVTVDSLSVFEEESTAYGIKVIKNNDELFALNNKFSSYKKAKAILSTLAKYKVTPISCNDIIEDLLKK